MEIVFMNNPIAETVQRLAMMIAVFIPVLIATTEGIKSLLDLKGKAAQVTEMGVNIFFGSMVVFEIHWLLCRKHRAALLTVERDYSVSFCI